VRPGRRRELGLGEVDGAAEESAGLRKGTFAERVLAGSLEMGERAARRAGPLPMMGEERMWAARSRCVIELQSLGDTPMEATALGEQQPAIHGIADQRVANHECPGEA